MLAAWMRMKYPGLIAGAVASSAPVLAFEGLHPPADAGSYARIVTFDAGPGAGAAPGCSAAVRRAWRALFELGGSEGGRRMARAALGLCPGAPLDDAADVLATAEWLQSALDYIAMGNFPYESSYITNGGGVLPAFPMRVGCELMAEAVAAPEPTATALLSGLAGFAALFYNASGDLPCLDWTRGANPETDLVALLWDFQSCTEMLMPMSRDGVRDMFWEQPWSRERFAAGCRERFGVEPIRNWAATQWGGHGALRDATNIFFANGEYDPWRGGGVAPTMSQGITSVVIPRAAHHLDLMFSNPNDTAEVKHVRKMQTDHITRW
eukprot:CAMPEP_0177602482 /NCGR_PEP_ID=MMETSP0419_2-20121207/14888_1 /TAXON_ID=582737 /ORGANISM="Tetraselmis sp., Strain GSL018" /LENGTH=322 /DNA_ID=CAMNT_0019095961 /DNA_START=1522 /DNA_END=2487 /DNA_ORIENTATION=+